MDVADVVDWISGTKGIALFFRNTEFECTEIGQIPVVVVVDTFGP